MNNVIVPFKRDSEFYFDLSEDSYYNGNFFSAISYIDQIEEPSKSDLNRFNFWRAKILADMHCIGQSNNYYFKLFTNKELESIASFEVASNFFSGGFFSKAQFYFKRCIEKDKFKFFAENAQKYLDIIARELKISKFKVVDGKTVHLIEQEDEDTDAQEIKINYDNKFKGAVKNILKSLKNKEYNSAIEVSENIIKNSSKTDFEQIFAHCAILTANFELKHADELEANAEKIKAFVDCSDIKTLELIATTLAGIKLHTYAKLFFDKIEKLAPYDYTTMFLNAICCFNNKDRHAALVKLNQISKIVKTDRILTYYLNEFQNADYRELDYFYILPDDAENKLLKELNEKLKEKDIALDINMLLNLEWLLYTNRTNVALKFIEIFLYDEKYENRIKELIKNIMIDTFIRDFTKRKLLEFIIFSGKFLNINIVVNDRYINLKLLNTKNIKIVSPLLLNAYARSISNIVLSGEESQNLLLNSIIKAAFENIKKQEKNIELNEDKLVKVIQSLSILPLKKAKIKTVLNNLSDYINLLGLNEFFVV